jgi:hypothetical protein
MVPPPAKWCWGQVVAGAPAELPDLPHIRVCVAPGRCGSGGRPAGSPFCPLLLRLHNTPANRRSWGARTAVRPEALRAMP